MPFGFLADGVLCALGDPALSDGGAPKLSDVQVLSEGSKAKKHTSRVG
jgi:hypothetical protein